MQGCPPVLVALLRLMAPMILIALATAPGAGLFPIVFAGAAEALPEEFSGLLQPAVHGWIATALAVLIILDISATVYHQPVRKDGLLRHMWIAARSFPGHPDGCGSPGLVVTPRAGATDRPTLSGNRGAPPPADRRPQVNAGSKEQAS